MSDEKHIKIWQYFVSSSIGAITTSVLVTPLDVIKIRMQAQHHPFSKGDCFIYCNGLMDHICQYNNGSNQNTSNICLKKNGNYINYLDAYKKIIKSEGIVSLWSGLSPTLILAIPQVVIYYTLNDWLKYALGYHSHRSELINPLSVQKSNSSFTKEDLIPPICGGIARCFAQATISPLELIRTKMQSKQLSYLEIRNITSNAIKQNGFGILWRGLGPTMWRDLPYTVTLWFTYEYLKKSYIKSHSYNPENEDFPYSLIVLYSVIGSFLAGIISHPFDVTKTHRQIELGNAILHDKRISPSTLAYLRNLKNSEGYSSLFTGFIPRILRVVIATTTMITIFETIKTYFINYNENKSRF